MGGRRFGEEGGSATKMERHEGGDHDAGEDGRQAIRAKAGQAGAAGIEGGCWERGQAPCERF